MGISDNAAYVVIDTKTGAIVYRTTYANRTRARRYADRKDNAWGAYRYVCRVLDTSPAGVKVAS